MTRRFRGPWMSKYLPARRDSANSTNTSNEPSHDTSDTEYRDNWLWIQ